MINILQTVSEKIQDLDNENFSKNFHNCFYFEKNPKLTPNLSNFATNLKNPKTQQYLTRNTQRGISGKTRRWVLWVTNPAES